MRCFAIVVNVGCQFCGILVVLVACLLAGWFTAVCGFALCCVVLFRFGADLDLGGWRLILGGCLRRVLPLDVLSLGCFVCDC